MSRLNNDVTGDRITNALKGDKEKYSEGCRSSDEDRLDRIFGNYEEAEDLGEASEEELKEGAKRSTQRVKKRADEIRKEVIE